MMTATDDIYAVACGFAQAETGEEELLRGVCAAVEQRLKQLLLEGTDVEEIYDSFVLAAGLMAAADFSAVCPSADVKQFSAGPISVTRDDDARARKLREQAALLMAPWCQDAFRFMGVKA